MQIVCGAGADVLIERFSERESSVGRSPLQFATNIDEWTPRLKKGYARAFSPVVSVERTRPGRILVRILRGDLKHAEGRVSELANASAGVLDVFFSPLFAVFGSGRDHLDFQFAHLRVAVLWFRRRELDPALEEVDGAELVS